MTYDLSENSRDTLRRAFRDQQLTLYLGAGVSVASALPTWDKLVLSVYFATISKAKLGKWRPFPNYLQAIAEWYLQEVGEPLEITARKLRQLYPEGEEGDGQFLSAVRDGLYRIGGSNLQDSGPPQIGNNSTLQAVAQLCLAKAGKRYGVRSVVTYNYDDLLERSLINSRKATPVYDQSPPKQKQLPIFHVHGFIPFPQDGGLQPSGVVFTEEEYNAAASDPYSWSNLVQLREMSCSKGLMIGLSLADRNIRRLLDALAHSPVRAQIYAVLKRPVRHVPNAAQVDGIDKAAKKLLTKFRNAGIKSRTHRDDDIGYEEKLDNGQAQVKSANRYQREIRGILEAVEDLAEDQETLVMKKLGITPIWYDDYAEIPLILKEISNA